MGLGVGEMSRLKKLASTSSVVVNAGWLRIGFLALIGFLPFALVVSRSSGKLYPNIEELPAYLWIVNILLFTLSSFGVFCVTYILSEAWKETASSAQDQ